MSHHHRNHWPPPTSQPEPLVSEPAPTLGAKFGFEALNVEELDITLNIVCHPGASDYVLALVEMLGKSKVYSTVVETVRKQCGGNKDLEMKMMFSLAVLTGASCMLTAVDEGLVEESGEGEFDGEEGD